MDRLTSGHDMLIVATRNGQAIRFNEEDARPMGRSGHGVRAIKLAEGDEVVGVCICREGGTVLTCDRKSARAAGPTSTPTASQPAAARASATTMPPRIRWPLSRSWMMWMTCC